MNKVMLIGNVGKEPRWRYYDADQAVAKVTLAHHRAGIYVEERHTVPDRTDGTTAVLPPLAKIVEQYVHKAISSM
jgi:single-strand DNA-binding protein